MPHIPLRTYRRISIDPNPVYNIETDSYWNDYYWFTTKNNITVFFAVIKAEYTVEYDYSYTELTIKFWEPTRTFTRTFVQHIPWLF